MSYLLPTLIFVFGLIIGSFLNVVILRYNTGKGIGGRSGCMSCGATLQTVDLIPLLSFVWNRGRCRFCGRPISWQYPLVEISTGVLFLLTYLAFGLPLSLTEIVIFLIYLIAIAILTVITVYDIKHKIIPDSFVYAFAMLGIIKLATLYFAGLSISAWDLLAGPILFLPFFLLWYFSKGQWIGLGDGKLALGIGWLLGLSSGGAAIILGVWIGAAVSIIMLIFYKIKLFKARNLLTMKSEVPFAPYLILGFLIVLFLHLNILSISMTFSF